MSFRPIEDIVIDKFIDGEGEWVDSGPISKYAKLPCGALKMVKGASVALVFDHKQLDYHKHEGWVVDMIYLRKEVIEV
jgi:hypothetical protein